MNDMNSEELDERYAAATRAGLNRRYDAVYSSGYYSRELFNVPERIILSYMEEAIKWPTHDTFVGTGVSGSIAAGILAVATGKMYAVVRKRLDGSHSERILEGNVGQRWLFVDDFIAGGNTRRHVYAMMRGFVPSSQFVGSWLYRDACFDPTVPDVPDVDERRSRPVIDLDKLPQATLSPAMVKIVGGL